MKTFELTAEDVEDIRLGDVTRVAGTMSIADRDAARLATRRRVRLGARSGCCSWDMYPDMTDATWWCAVVLFSRCSGGREFAGSEYDNTRTLRPFQRPRTAENSVHA
jgi:hypothetical protein